MALAAVSDIVEFVSVPVTGSSEKLEVIPAGMPLTLSPTPPFELLARCSVSPIVPDVRPWVTSIPLPSESSVKLGGGGVEGRVSAMSSIPIGFGWSLAFTYTWVTSK